MDEILTKLLLERVHYDQILNNIEYRLKNICENNTIYDEYLDKLYDEKSESEKRTYSLQLDLARMKNEQIHTGKIEIDYIGISTEDRAMLHRKLFLLVKSIPGLSYKTVENTSVLKYGQNDYNIEDC